MNDPVLTFRLVTEENFPGGVQCTLCNREILPGQPFESRPESANVEIITCVYCEAS